MNPRPDPRLRMSAHALNLILREHRDLPDLNWTVTRHGLTGHVRVDGFDPDRERAIFAVWTTALDLQRLDNQPGCPGCIDPRTLRSAGTVHSTTVAITATIHAF